MKILNIKLTEPELEALLFLVRDASNEPSDVDHEALKSLCTKVETAAG